MRQSLHQTTVACEHEGAVVHDGVAVSIEFNGEQLLRQRHSDSVGETLAKRPGGGLDAGGQAYFGVPWRAAAQLAEGQQVRCSHVVARQMQQPYNSIEPCPLDSTKRSRSAHAGS